MKEGIQLCNNICTYVDINVWLTFKPLQNFVLEFRITHSVVQKGSYSRSNIVGGITDLSRPGFSIKT